MIKAFLAVVVVVNMFVGLYSFAAEPMVGIPVVVTKGEKVFDTVTDEAGRFSLKKLPTGKYNVSVFVLPQTLVLTLSKNGQTKLSLIEPTAQTHFVITRKDKTLSGKITNDIFIPSPLPTPTE